jgi:hypothetical protein
LQDLQIVLSDTVNQPGMRYISQLDRELTRIDSWIIRKFR